MAEDRDQHRAIASCRANISSSRLAHRRGPWASRAKCTSSTPLRSWNWTPYRAASVLIGAGYISLEFAHLARRAGAEVDGARARRAASRIRSTRSSSDLSSTVVKSASTLRLDAFRDRDRVRIPGTSALRVHAGKGASACVIEADLVVHGAGRVPNSVAHWSGCGEHSSSRHHGADSRQRVPAERLEPSGVCGGRCCRHTGIIRADASGRARGSSGRDRICSRATRRVRIFAVRRASSSRCRRWRRWGSPKRPRARRE